MSGQVPLSLDYSYLLPDVTPEELGMRQPQVALAHTKLHEQSGPGNAFLGWMAPQDIMPSALLEEIQQTAATLRQQADVMVVIGIGGSYLGARTVIEALVPADQQGVVYAGQTLSADYLASLRHYLKDKRYCLNIISKSGETIEPAVAFRILRKDLEEKVGKDEARKLIVATTDASKGTLRKLAGAEEYKTFVIPDNVGGRYSVFTPVGMLPIAFAGVDIPALIAGAATCAQACGTADLAKNPAYLYAVARNLLYSKGKAIELMVTFEPRLRYLAEWWKQLYGESEGKDLMGIFPASVEFTTDLHSMGQWIQEGRRIIFETFINIAKCGTDVDVPPVDGDPDGLNFLTDQHLTLDAINHRAYEGTALAHRDGGVPSMTITLPELNATTLGALLYFFEKACGLSGYLLGVNPFNQPGVEAYKRNMFALLRKPGFQEQADRVLQAVQEHQGKHVVEF